MTSLFIIEKHDLLLKLWREADARDLRITHVDFHDDLRECLVDRKRGVAHRSGIGPAFDTPPDEGNFLTHAVLEGRVKSIHWVRGRVGGRAYDSGIVRYETDLAAIPHRWSHARRKGPEAKLDYREIIFEDWDGHSGDTCLDLDWDFFAFRDFDPEGTLDRLAEFLKRNESANPSEIYLCYSPDYAAPSREIFLTAIERIAAAYDAEPVWPFGNFLETLPDTLSPTPPLSISTRLIRALRRRGIY